MSQSMLNLEVFVVELTFDAAILLQSVEVYFFPKVDLHDLLLFFKLEDIHIPILGEVDYVFIPFGDMADGRNAHIHLG